MGSDQTRNLLFNPIPHFTGDWAGMGGWSGLAAVGVTAWHKNGGTLTLRLRVLRGAERAVGGNGDGRFRQIPVGQLANGSCRMPLAERGSIPPCPPRCPTRLQPKQPATDADLAAIVGDYAQFEALLRIEALPTAA